MPSAPSKKLFDVLIAEAVESEGVTLTSAAQFEVQKAIARGLRAIKEHDMSAEAAVHLFQRMMNAAVSIAQARSENRNRVDAGVINQIKAESDYCPNIFCLDKKEAAREKRRSLTKSGILAAVAEAIGEGVSRTQVAGVIDALADVGYRELNKKGVFVLPGFAKFVVVKKPARAAREGINPFSKQKQAFAAKPSSKAIRARPVKAIKDAV